MRVPFASFALALVALLAAGSDGTHERGSSRRPANPRASTRRTMRKLLGKSQPKDDKGHASKSSSSTGGSAASNKLTDTPLTSSPKPISNAGSHSIAQHNEFQGSPMPRSPSSVGGFSLPPQAEANNGIPNIPRRSSRKAKKEQNGMPNPRQTSRRGATSNNQPRAMPKIIQGSSTDGSQSRRSTTPRSSGTSLTTPSTRYRSGDSIIIVERPRRSRRTFYRRQSGDDSISSMSEFDFFDDDSSSGFFSGEDIDFEENPHGGLARVNVNTSSFSEDEKIINVSVNGERIPDFKCAGNSHISTCVKQYRPELLQANLEIVLHDTATGERCIIEEYEKVDMRSYENKEVVVTSMDADVFLKVVLSRNDSYLFQVSYQFKDTVNVLKEKAKLYLSELEDELTADVKVFYYTLDKRRRWNPIEQPSKDTIEWAKSESLDEIIVMALF